MGGVINLTGQRFEPLLVTERAENGKHNTTRWKVVCQCGQSKIVRASHLRAGLTRSCSCLRKESMAKARHNLKHGHSSRSGNRRVSPTYVSYSSMRLRCLTPSATSYLQYGGANPPVTVCDRWLGPDGFSNFLQDVGERPLGTTLGRFGDVGNYEPGNVAWQTWADQVASRRQIESSAVRIRKNLSSK